MSFSIKDFSMQSVEMELLNPQTGAPIKAPKSKVPVILNIVSMDSREFVLGQATALRKLQAIIEQTKVEPTEEQKREVTYEILVGLVCGWNEEADKFFADELGEDSKFSRENALKLLSQSQYYWVVKQIETFIADRTRFFLKA